MYRSPLHEPLESRRSDNEACFVTFSRGYCKIVCSANMHILFILNHLRLIMNTGGSMNNAIRILSGFLLLSCGHVSQSYAQMSEMQSDRAHRDMAIRWPAAYDPSVAPVFSHNELLIHADCPRTFVQLANARRLAQLACHRQRCCERDTGQNWPGRALSSQDLQ